MAFSFFFRLKHGINLRIVEQLDPSFGFPGHLDPIILHSFMHILMIIAIERPKLLVLIAYILKSIPLLTSISLDAIG